MMLLLLVSGVFFPVGDINEVKCATINIPYPFVCMKLNLMYASV